MQIHGEGAVGQILKEADRIPEKYLLTLDKGLTDDAIARIVAHQVSVFLPAPILTRAYAERSGAEKLRTAGKLIELLMAAI